VSFGVGRRLWFVGRIPRRVTPLGHDLGGYTPSRVPTRPPLSVGEIDQIAPIFPSSSAQPTRLYDAGQRGLARARQTAAWPRFSINRGLGIEQGARVGVAWCTTAPVTA
jgi:hypothetical protein